jgi:hypothetical protein
VTDKRQTRPLVREGALIGQGRNCQTVNKHLVMSLRWSSAPRHTDRPTVSRKVTLTLAGHVCGVIDSYMSCGYQVCKISDRYKHQVVLVIPFNYKQTNKQTNSVALSLRANYTDWASTTCQRNLVRTFVDRGVSRDQRGGSPTVVNISFLDRSRYFSFK